ncbi:MAG: flagellar M-ring protein FliF [Desulfovibrio sp.]|nr:flagellar M-ring protein FliF [Desulfovibrio sp.]
MKPQKSKSKDLVLSGQGGVSPLSLDELREQRRARLETNRRIESLKLSLLRSAEQNIDQAVRLIRRWLWSDKK